MNVLEVISTVLDFKQKHVKLSTETAVMKIKHCGRQAFQSIVDALPLILCNLFVCIFLG